MVSISRRHQPPAATFFSGCKGSVCQSLAAGEHAQAADRRVHGERRDQARLNIGGRLQALGCRRAAG